MIPELITWRPSSPAPRPHFTLTFQFHIVFAHQLVPNSEVYSSAFTSVQLPPPLPSLSSAPVMVSGVLIGAGLRLPLPRSSWGPRLSSSLPLAISVKTAASLHLCPGSTSTGRLLSAAFSLPLCWLLLHLHTGSSILPYLALCFLLFSYMPGPWPSDPCLPETAGPSQVQNGRDPCPSLPLGPECSLTLRSLLCTHTFLWDWRLAFLPPLRPLLFGFFGWPPAFFCPASQVLCPAFYLSLHSNWEISVSVISLKTRMPASHQARPVSWASDTSTRPPSGPSSSARSN